MVFDVLTPAQAFSGFSNHAVFTVGALFIVAAGVQKTRALSFLENLVFSSNNSSNAVMLKMMASTSVMSAFLNNTPIVAMLIPQVQEWCERTGRSVSKFLIPLSYAAIVGGVVTLIGTSTNLIVSGMLTDRGMEPLGLFELTWIGLPAAIIVALYFSGIGHRLLPDYSSKADRKNSGQSGYQFDVKIPENSDLDGLSIEQAGLRALENVFLIHIYRNKQVIGPVGPHVLLQSGDILTFMGELKNVDDLAIRKGLERAVPVLDKSEKDLPVFEAVVAPTSALVGKTLKEFEFREKYHAVVVGIQRKEESIRGALGNIPIMAGDLLLIEAKPGFDEIHNSDKNEFYLVSGKGLRSFPKSEMAPVSLLIMVLMIGLAAFNILPISVSAIIAAILMVLTGCVKSEQILNLINLPILLVIAAAIGIGQAIEVTGIAKIGGEYILQQTSGFGIIAIFVAIYLLTNLLTEIITNNAAAVLVLPIAIYAGADAGLDPHAVALTVAVAASASFLTPIGYQTNLMVMGAGKYKFFDYFRAGLPVTFIMLLVTMTVIYLKYL